MIYADGHLYMMYYNSISNVTIDSFPFTNPTAPPPTARQVFKGPENFRSKYFFTGTRGNTTFLGGLGNYKKTNLVNISLLTSILWWFFFVEKLLNFIGTCIFENVRPRSTAHSPWT
jgi:hypothetical protein